MGGSLENEEDLEHADFRFVSPRFGNINWHMRKHVDLVVHYSFVPLIKISPLIKMIGGGHSEIVVVNCVVDLY